MYLFSKTYKVTFLMLLLLCLVLSSGCTTTAGNIVLGVAAITSYGAYSPGHEIEQTFYMGVFDPQNQVDPMMYRIRVTGQASIISSIKFASGWVPAKLIDSLGTKISFSKQNGAIELTKTDDTYSSSLSTGKRLVLFGPEGFREAPKNQRLVILMGSNPEEYFNAIDQTLGIVSDEIAAQKDSKFIQELLKAEIQLQNEKLRLKDITTDIENEFPDIKKRNL